jgi:hypothetical protein
MADEETGWRIANWLWDRRDEIGRKLADLYRWIRGQASQEKPNRGVLILGPGGTGKTTLAWILTGEVNWLLDSPWEYSQSIHTEQYRLPGTPAVEVVVPPG